MQTLRNIFSAPIHWFEGFQRDYGIIGVIALGIAVTLACVMIYFYFDRRR